MIFLKGLYHTDCGAVVYLRETDGKKYYGHIVGEEDEELIWDLNGNCLSKKRGFNLMRFIRTEENYNEAKDSKRSFERTFNKSNHLGRKWKQERVQSSKIEQPGNA